MTEMLHPTTERLEAYVEGLLNQSDRVVIDSHLLGCPRCQQEVDEWLALFAALSDLPELTPSPNFADRVMARVRISPRKAWQEQTARAGALIARVLPKSTFGWGVATALLALPVLLGGGITAWLLSKPYVSVATLWTYASTLIVDGVVGLGSGFVSTIMQTDVVAWSVEQGRALLSAAGTSGVGVGGIALAAVGATTLSIWVLYRNLFRSPSKDSNYALFTV
jgi:hypothetical protein